jgi:hypothetical protein
LQLLNIYPFGGDICKHLQPSWRCPFKEFRMLALKCSVKRPFTIAAVAVLSTALLTADVTGAAALQRSVGGFSGHGVVSHAIAGRGALHPGFAGRGTVYAGRHHGRYPYGYQPDDGAVAAAVFGGLALGLLGAAAGGY